MGIGSHVKIGDRLIGLGQPIFVMADVGLTNGGSLDRAFLLIDICRALGVDAIKFQMIGPEFLLGDKTIAYTYPTLNDGQKTENMFEMFSDLTFSPAQWKRIVAAARNAGLEFVCTSHYLGAVDVLEGCGVNCHKVCSWSVTHKRLIQKMGRTRKPMFMDMGTSTQAMLQELIHWHSNSGGRGTIPLHDFHTKELTEVNFRSIPHIKRNFGCPVGYTSPGRSSHHDFMAIGLGVSVLEKRLTHDRSIPKNGHAKALEPEEFREWLHTVRDLELSLGSSMIIPSQEDLKQSRKYFKSLFAIRDIKKGERITDEMVDGRRPGTGISAKNVDLIVGRWARADIKSGKMISWDMVVSCQA